jgi:hypothetical protein
VLEDVAQEEAMVGTNPAVERLAHVGNAPPQAPTRRRKRPRAYSAICAVPCSPAMSASSIARPLTPKTLEATAANLMFALSSTFCSRFAYWVRS